MTLPRSVADVLSEHVVFEVECIDRMYLNVYVPQLQYATGLVSYIHRHLGMPVASTVALAPVTEGFTRSVRAFAASRGIPWVDFARGQRKDDVAHEFLAGFTGTEGVLFIGRAQEKTTVFRTRKRRREDGSSYPWIAPDTAVINHFYCYCVDEDFGPYADPPVMPRRVVLSWSGASFPVPARHCGLVACGQRVSRKARRLSGAVYRPEGVPSGASLERACSLSAMSACR